MILENLPSECPTCGASWWRIQIERSGGGDLEREYISFNCGLVLNWRSQSGLEPAAGTCETHVVDQAAAMLALLPTAGLEQRRFRTAIAHTFSDEVLLKAEAKLKVVASAAASAAVAAKA